MSSRKRKVVFLFGAGAPLIWDAPTTKGITDLVRSSGYNIKNSDQKITEFIFQKCLEEGLPETDINFETILAAIEELIVYHANVYKDAGVEFKPRSLFRAIFMNKYPQILNYITQGEKVKHGFKIFIPNPSTGRISEEDIQHQSKGEYFRESPDAVFLINLLNKILSIINARVQKYSFRPKGDCDKITKYDPQNNLISQWIKRNYNNHVKRIYTLNYDYNFKTILEKNSIEIFDGFKEKSSESESHTDPDIVKILNDMDCNIHYNLHGASSWRVMPSSPIHKNHYSIKKGEYARLNYEWTNLIQIEKHKSILVSNIVTGYQKTQKSAITPLRQMHATFEKDCIGAEIMVIIGYSFGDVHINQIIRTAIIEGDSMIHIVSPKASTLFEDYHSLTYFTLENDRNLNSTAFKKGDNITQYLDKKITTYNMSFEEYLKIGV